MNNYLMMV